MELLPLACLAAYSKKLSMLKLLKKNAFKYIKTRSGCFKKKRKEKRSFLGIEVNFIENLARNTLKNLTLTIKRAVWSCSSVVNLCI